MADIAFPRLAKRQAAVAAGIAKQPTAFTAPVVTMPNGLLLETLSGREAFEALEGDWNALFERAGRSHQVFQTFNWMWHWCHTYLWGGIEEDERELAIVTGRLDGRLVMCWPLVMERRSGQRHLRWMGEPVGQYGDVLVDEHGDALAWLRAGWRVVREELGADLVLLSNVRSDAAVAPVLGDHAGEVLLHRQAASLNLSRVPDFETLAKGMSRSAARDRRRKRRRLEKFGEVRFVVHTEGEVARAASRRALAIKRDWLRRKGLVSKAFLDRNLDEFFTSVAGSREHPTGCRVSELTLDGRSVALEIGFVCKGRHAVHVLTFDDAFERCSPGVLQIEATLRHCFDDDVRCYDLLAPADAYKLKWADTTVDVSDHAFALSARGRLFVQLYCKGLYRFAKFAHEHIPLGLRQKLATFALGRRAG